MTEQEVIEELKTRLSQSRLNHVLGVRDSAIELAQKYEVDIEKARWAALLHDCAKELSNNILLQKAKEFGIVIDNAFREEPGLLHAPVGARIARRDFGITNEEILTAIRVHTLGRRNMSTLDKIIFLADHTEPSRTGGEKDKLRQHIKNDAEERSLDQAVRIACEDTIRYHLNLGEIIHPQTVAARNSLL